MSEDREPRDIESREEEARPASFRPPSLLPDPLPQAGWVFRWVQNINGWAV